VQQPLLSEIKHAGDRASARQLLAFGRKQVLSTRPLSLNKLVTDIESMLRRLIGEHIDLRTSLAPDVWPVLADQGQLEQVVMNLGINARDAMPSGGRLTIATSNLAHDQKSFVDQRELPAGDFVMLSVSDTGCGMSVEVKHRIFEPFFTTKELGKGTGLGLAVVYGIVKQSGGFIHVVSEPSHGSVFVIYLPRHHELDLEAPVTMTHSSFTNFRGDETILFVEDDDAVRFFTSAILRRAGYHVVEAADGREALEKFRTQNLSCNLVVTDVIMPEMSGSQLADELRAWRPGLRVLFISGYTDNSIDAEDLAVPGTAFLAKPFASEPLAGKVRELLDLPVPR
jgi:CheY-like chemotaxis protein